VGSPVFNTWFSPVEIRGFPRIILQKGFSPLRRQITFNLNIYSMAKKAGKSPAFEFDFRGADLKKLLASEPAVVRFTVSVEAVDKKGGGQVGALRISAKGISGSSNRTTRRGNGINGDPRPPGMPD
jgi:hypothetical protein